MKQLILDIVINRPLEAVFDYVIDPSHSPDWIDSFKKEEAAPWPPRIGTLYRNCNHQGDWTEYRVEAFKPPRHFGIAQVGGDYHAEYLLSSPAPDTTKLIYHEWVTSGELADHFPSAALEKLKRNLEAAA